MEIVVAAEVLDASTGGHCTTNVFYYTYSNDVPVPQVIPKTYHEAMWYLDGRRHFNAAMNSCTTEPRFKRIKPSVK